MKPEVNCAQSRDMVLVVSCFLLWPYPNVCSWRTLVQ